MPDFIQASCVACLSCEAVGERLGKVVSVPHPGGRVPQGDSGCIQQARVGVSEYVPAHPLPVKGAEGGDEGAEGWGVGPAYWEVKAIKKTSRSLAERDYPKTLRRLRGVDSPTPVAGAPDPEEMAVYVAWLDGDYLPPTEASQQDELRHLPMHPRHTLDDVLDVLEAEGVLTGGRLRDADATRGDGQMGDDSPTLGVSEARCECRVDAGDGCRCQPEGELGLDEGREVLVAEGADGVVAHHRLDPADAGPVGGEAVVAGVRVPLLRGVPDIEGFTDRFCPTTGEACQSGFSFGSRLTCWGVCVATTGLAADQPRAATGVPFPARVPALLHDDSHETPGETRGDDMRNPSAEAASEANKTRSGYGVGPSDCPSLAGSRPNGSGETGGDGVLPGGQGVYDADHRYRDQILYSRRNPDWAWDVAVWRWFRTPRASQDVQDVQAPSAQAVTGGHGRCECSECSTGWAHWWATR